MKRGHSLLAVLALAAAVSDWGCKNEGARKVASAEPTATTAAALVATTSPDTTTWDSEALQVAEKLAATLRTASVPCNGFEPGVFSLHAADSARSGLPLPKALASCTSEDDEDLSFEVFESPQRAREFVDAKMTLLCKRANALQLSAFPGFPYVDGGAWIVEPDEKATAERIAPILGGEAKMASCSSG